MKTGMRILFTGDVILSRGVEDELRLHGDTLFINSVRRTHGGDYVVVNYEGTFTDSDNAQDDLYNFKADESVTSLLYQSGITHVSIANNHIYDYGRIGYENTLSALKKNGITVLGETSVPVILKKRGHKCAVLSASLTTNNDSLPISNIDQLKRTVEEFREEHPIIPLILYVHWGLEIQPTPEPWQRELAKKLIESGVNAIIGHHPHVVQSIEFIHGAPVFYSIGNYVADAYLPDTDFGYCVEASFTNDIVVKIKPITLERYFPIEVKATEQFPLIRKILSNSDGICAFQSKHGWILKPIESIDFQEETDLWVFAKNQIIAAIKKTQSGLYLMTLFTQNEKSNTVSLHGQLSKIEISDINNDDTLDVLLAISKKVHFDPEYKKRINIYTFENQNLQPLWLGTKFVYDIYNFSVFKSGHISYLLTNEVDNSGEKYQGIYQWDDFGFTLNEMKQLNKNENN